MEGSPSSESKAKKVQSARPVKKMQLVKERDSELQEGDFTAKRAKSISATKSMRIGDTNNNNKEEEVIEVSEESFLAKKEAPTLRKNSVGELLNKKISIDSALHARTQKKKENIPENNDSSSDILDNKEEKEEKDENEEGNNDDSKKLSKDERRAKRKKKQERRDKRKDKLEKDLQINLDDKDEKEEDEEKGGDIEINDDNLDDGNINNSAERKSSINDILTRRSSIGIVSPRIIQTKSYQSEQKLESDEGKVSFAKPQTESSGNRVLYQQVGSQLHYHTATGNWEIVKDLIDSSPDSIEHRSEDGRTILHISASLGHLAIVKGLLERNVDINITMNNGLTPLMLCTAQGKADVVQLLLDFGASYCTQTVKDGYTALHLACMHRQVQTAQVLLSFIKEQTLAQKSKGKKDAKAIMSGTLPLNEYIEVRSTKGYSAFHLATVEGDLAILQLLVEFGADYKAITSKKWTPIHFAAHIGNLEICQFLLNIDSNMVDLKNEAKEKAFDIAVFQKHETLLEILTPKIQSKPKKQKKKKEKKEKKEKREKNNNNNNEEIIIELPKFEGDENECLIDRITKRPALLKEMKEDGTVFMSQIPPDSQMLLFNEAKDNPHLLEELLSIGREVLIELIEENPHLLLTTVQSPISILKKVKTPAKLFKLLKQVEENPMIFMKDDCREDPELFFLQQLRDNPYLRYLVVSKLRERKPSLLPLIKAFIGVEADEIQEPDEDKSMKTKMTNKLMKATVSKYLKKIIDSDGKDVNIAGLDAEGLQQLKDVMQEDDVGKLMEKKGIKGPLFSLEEIPEVEELPFDELD